MRDYILSDYGFNASEDEVNQDSFVAAANICDEVIGEIRSDSNEVILVAGYTRYTKCPFY
jgi:hypothetical protein